MALTFTTIDMETQILTSFIGGAFSLLSIYLSHHLQRQGNAAGAIRRSVSGILNRYPTDIRQRLKQYCRWFWITVLIAVPISLSDLIAPLLGYILHEYLVVLLLIPVYVLQTYFLMLYFGEVLPHRVLWRSGTFFGVIALLFGAVGSPIFAFLIAYVQHCRKRSRSVTLQIAQNLKNINMTDQVIAQVTGLSLEEVSILNSP